MLLLPTDIYVAAGVLAVALTVALLGILPAQGAMGLFSSIRLFRVRRGNLSVLTNLASSLILAWLLYAGLHGPRDPLSNPLPLAVWSLWWVAFVFVQGCLGDLWRWINPWRGVLIVLRRVIGGQAPFRYPAGVGHGIGGTLFFGFVAFLLADPAPSDPARLARMVGLYWAVMVLGGLAFGPRWDLRADGISMVMRLYASLGVFGARAGQIKFGFWGWQIAQGRQLSPGLAVLCLVILAGGSFDGVNETFWWLAQLGLNPLEFPGRSAVITETLAGLIASIIALVGVFYAAIWMGIKLGKIDMRMRAAVCLFAPTVLPIALGYHFAHYFTSFLVEAQYALAAATDPWATGQDLLGLGQFYVTTGFFNTQASVRVLWLGQAGAVVVGHIVAVLLAHAVAVRHIGVGRAAILSQLPLAIFMICYTFFGLWLLASPRGF